MIRFLAVPIASGKVPTNPRPPLAKRPRSLKTSYLQRPPLGGRTPNLEPSHPPFPRVQHLSHPPLQVHEIQTNLPGALPSLNSDGPIEAGTYFILQS